MRSLIDRLADTIPSISEEWREYRDTSYGRVDELSVQASELATHVVALLAANRPQELQSFLAALEELYLGPLDDESSNALYEGFMESLIYKVGHRQIPPAEVYRHLLPKSRRAWEQHWKYIHNADWTDS